MAHLVAGTLQDPPGIPPLHQCARRQTAHQGTGRQSIAEHLGRLAPSEREPSKILANPIVRQMPCLGVRTGRMRRVGTVPCRAPSLSGQLCAPRHGGRIIPRPLCFFATMTMRPGSPGVQHLGCVSEFAGMRREKRHAARRWD